MDYSKFSEETLRKISENEPLDYSQLSDVELEEISSQSKAAAPIATETPMPEEIGQLESGIRGAADYGSFGFADELEAMFRSGAISGEEYEKKRDELREVYKQAAEQNPLTYHGAGIAAGFALPIGGIGGFATKGATLGAKLAKSAGMGAGMGALAGAGTSEAEGVTGMLGDVATGAAAGAIAGPAIEGGLSALGRLGKGAYENIGPVKAIIDTAKFAAKGERIAGEEGGRITTAKALKASEELVNELKTVQEAKNKAYRSAEAASDFEIKVSELREKIQRAEEQGADPAQLKNLKRLLNKLAGEPEPVSPGATDEMSALLGETYGPTAAPEVAAEAEKTLKPADLNLLKQEAKKIKSRIYGAPSEAATELSTDLNKLYKSSIDPTEAEGIDKNLREALAKLGMSGSMSKPQLSAQEIERLTDRLLKKAIKAGESKGSVEFKKTEDAFQKLISALPEGSPERLQLESKIKNLKEEAYKSFLSDITRGHNTFAISPSNLNWTMTAAGKLGFAAEASGAAYRGIVNSTPGQLMGMANKMVERGYRKYADTLNKIAGTEDVNKRRALTFTLLQNPEFRELMSPEIFSTGEE